MLVVISNDLPPAVRGRMKLWFIEPKPNVFISGLTDHIAKKVVSYLYDFCPPTAGVLIIRSISNPPGYDLSFIGAPSKELIELSGLQLILEKNTNSSNLIKHNI